MWRNKDYVDGVAEALKAVGGVCPRCILRFCGFRLARDFKKPPSEAEDAPPEKRAKMDPCRICCGLLQDEFMTEAMNDVKDTIRAGDYVSDHYGVSLSIPASLLLREHSAAVHVSSRFKDFDEGEVLSFKQAWKLVYPHTIERDLVPMKHLTGNDGCQFFAEIQFDSGSEKEDEKYLMGLMSKEEFNQRNSNPKKFKDGSVTRLALEKTLKEVSVEKFRKRYPVPPIPPDAKMSHKVVLYHNSVFLVGRYNKFSRKLPGSPWVLNGTRIMESSVEELISDPLKSLLKFDNSIFAASGREDVDVRMLGKGRPFLLEIVNPRKARCDVQKIEQEVNKSPKISVRDLAIVNKDLRQQLKDGEDSKQKVYQALCVFPMGKEETLQEAKEILMKLNDVQDLEVTQNTPIRVLHRRSDLPRQRTVHRMNVHFIEPETEEKAKEKGFLKFKLDLTTQAGTYIKEFVHGDFGRTEPNLCSILGRKDIDIIALDVAEVLMDWPPKFLSQ